MSSGSVLRGRRFGMTTPRAQALSFNTHMGGCSKWALGNAYSAATDFFLLKLEHRLLFCVVWFAFHFVYCGGDSNKENLLPMKR